MKRSAIIRWAVVLTTVTLTIAFLLLPSLGAVSPAFAQDQVPAVETTVTEVPTATSTNTPVPPTVTPTPTNTPVGPTNTPTQVVTLPPDTPTPTPIPSGPVPIPEPVTVVLFGTGLAALSAALASRRKTEE